MSLEKIAEVVKNNNSFVILPHTNPDGDSIGSATALCMAIRNLGKKCDIIAEKPIASNLMYMWNDDFDGSTNGCYDVCICVDCADVSRIKDFRELVFDKCKIKVCIDHHRTNNGFADFNYVDADASAAGEIIFDFVKNYLKSDINKDIADRLYSAIASDTGNFKYSNTTQKTHIIAANLIELGANFAYIGKMLFDTFTLSQINAQSEAIKNLKMFSNGKIAVIFITEEYLSKNNMTFNDVDYLSSFPRQIEGVEIGVYMKVKKDEIKVSLRSNDADVSKIAAEFGGGGHKLAAGASIHDTLDNAINLVVDRAKKQINS